MNGDGGRRRAGAHRETTFRRRALAVAGACVVSVAGGWNMANVGAVADSLAGAYGVGLGTVGLLTTALFIGYAGLLVPSGRLVDRAGPKGTGLAALAALGLLNGVALIAPDLALALGARMLIGVATAVAFVAGTNFVHGIRGSAFAHGLYGGAGLGGAGLALGVVPQLETLVEWRAPYLSALAVSLAGAAVLASLPRFPATRERWAPVSLRRLITNFRVRRLAVVQTASFGLNVVVGNWVVTLVHRHGIEDLGVAGLAGAGTLAMGVVSRPAGGWLVRRAPQHRVVIVAASLLVGGTSTVLLAFAPSVAAIIALSMGVGLAAGLPFGPILEAAADAQPRSPAATAGLINTFTGIAVLIGTPLVGLTFALPGAGRIGFAVVAVLWAASAIAVPGAFASRRGRSRSVGAAASGGEVEAAGRRG